MSTFNKQGEFPILQVKNLPYKVNPDDLYSLFGQFGDVHEVRLGDSKEAKGKAFVVYKNYTSCVEAVTKLKGFNFNGRYLVVGIYHVDEEALSKVKEAREVEE